MKKLFEKINTWLNNKIRNLVTIEPVKKKREVKETLVERNGEIWHIYEAEQ